MRLLSINKTRFVKNRSSLCKIIFVEIICPSLPPLENGITRPVEYSTTFGSVVSFRCHLGFEFSSGQRDNILRCEDSGEWDQSFLECKGEKIFMFGQLN